MKSKTKEKECYLCGFKELQEALHRHHIDRCRENGGKDNLVILCVRCHLHIHRVIKEWETYVSIEQDSCSAFKQKMIRIHGKKFFDLVLKGSWGEFIKEVLEDQKSKKINVPVIYK